ncbi:replication initiation protein [Bacillus pseudomycoides]|uniref:Replication initiation protein n=1 Tax=Bacillus pseudomycoides TaxID=64104 RepID=A0AA91VEY5_9BACI|nr:MULTISPECIES: primase C-terminal domain-containing protein [Bacillus]PEB54336.1 replication initiation protein [Bacillus sp. AFS098217]PED83983.1 replication initiation protein [Bacillus pseudomycoides]PEU05803.1 replication initiation protein [Bacillus sp. AFS019443]
MDKAQQAIELILHSGLRKYKYKNSRASIAMLDSQDTSKMNDRFVFITRTKEDLMHPYGAKGVVLTSQEAVLDHIGQATHWTPNVFRVGTYLDRSRRIIKGHEERNLKQINCFTVDIDTKDITPGEIVLAAMDKQLGMPTVILESVKGYQAYFVLDNPLFISNKNDFRGLRSAKRISENIRKALSDLLPGVDLTCNDFGFFRMPNEENVVWMDAESTCNLAHLIEWSKDQDIGHRRNLFTVLSNKPMHTTQITEGWVQKVLVCTHIHGQKGLIGRDNAVFTLALACYSSGMTEKDAYNLLDQFNTNLNSPLKNASIQKAVRSAFSGKYKGANKAYINHILEVWSDGEVSFSGPVPSQYWYKHKKARKERVRSHWYEWEQDIIDFLNAQKDTEKGFVYFTQKELCEALQIPRSTLNSVLKKSKQIYIHVIGKGSQRQTGLSTLALLFNHAIGRNKEQKELYLEFIQSIIPSAAERLYELTQEQTNDLITLNTG